MPDDVEIPDELPAELSELVECPCVEANAKDGGAGPIEGCRACGGDGKLTPEMRRKVLRAMELVELAKLPLSGLVGLIVAGGDAAEGAKQELDRREKMFVATAAWVARMASAEASARGAVVVGECGICKGPVARHRSRSGPFCLRCGWTK